MRIGSNKVNSIINFFKSELEKIYPAGEINEFIFLSFEHILKYSRTDIQIKNNKTVNESDLLQFNKIIKELKQERPIQYILGETVFYRIKINVNDKVLIPRPETEELIDLIIKENQSKISNLKSPISILDIGTGSGCIAIALKKNMPNTHLYGLDSSTEALKIAKQNAINNKVEVEFYHADILNFNTWQLANFPTQFNIIVSNPPYITYSEKEKMSKNIVSYEPHQALFVENNSPFIFYEKITDYALKHLEKKGNLYFEINEKYGAEISELLKGKGFKAQILKDINGKDRMVKSKYF